MSNICELIFKSEKVFLPISVIAVYDLKCMFNIKPDGIHLKAKVKEEWKHFYPNDNGFFQLPLSINGAYVIGMPASQVSASQFSVAVQQAPKLYESPLNNNPHASSTFSTTCNPHQSPVPYSPMTCLTNHGNSGRSIPPLKRSMTNSNSSWGTQPIYESFIPTEVDGGNRLNDIIEVNVDLNKLSRFCGNFDINDIQKEVCIQMRVEGTMVMLHKSETPVKDTPNTRGIVAWSSKAQYRVMMVDIFKKYKPSSWDVVKGDYGYTDEVPDYAELSPLFSTDEFLNNNVFSTNDRNTENKGHIFKAISTGICTTAKEISDKFYNDTANHTKTLDIDTRKCISDGKEELLTEICRQNTNDTIKAIFKCIVCYESRPDSFAVCLHYGRYLGCHTCIGRLSKCPLCRKEFRCVKCSNDLPKKPLFFPGIEEFFDIPVSSVPNPPALLDLQGYDTYDTLPAVSGA